MVEMTIRISGAEGYEYVQITDPPSDDDLLVFPGGVVMSVGGTTVAEASRRLIAKIATAIGHEEVFGDGDLAAALGVRRAREGGGR